jgi:hypothetical protein
VLRVGVASTPPLEIGWSGSPGGPGRRRSAALSIYIYRCEEGFAGALPLSLPVTVATVEAKA